MKRIGCKMWALALLLTIFLTGCSFGGGNPVSVEVWHNFDGSQKMVFDQLVSEFNETEGISKGIIVEGFTQGTLEDLEVRLLNSINGKVGYDGIPDIFATSPDFAYRVDEGGHLVDIGNHMKKSEMATFNAMCLQEGYIGKDKKLKMLPIGAATEVLMVNKTDWDKFEKATGASLEALETWEGLSGVAEDYYNWTNSLTEEADDGKAFFTRDNLTNFFMVGAHQLGEEMLQINGESVEIEVDNGAMRRMWDHYYIPYINGYYGSFERYGSDDFKTGKVIAYLGSTGDLNYLSDKVTTEANTSYEIETLILPVPNFAKADKVAILQGAGMAVLKSNEAQEKASVEFLKWITSSEKNIEFAAATGYLPVTKMESENSQHTLLQTEQENVSPQVKKGLPLAIEQVNEYDMYINQAFNNSSEVKKVLDSSLINRAKVDRQKVVTLMDGGEARQEAISTVVTESNFEQWVVRFKMEVKGVVK